jgi:hypothetical protein
VFARNFYLFALALSTACATTGTGSAPTGRNQNVITEDEITASHESNVYDLIRSLRPMYLKSRGRSSINGSGSDYASVFMDGQLYGDISTLRNLVPSQIHEIRYYSATDAMTRFGMQAGGGAIDIHTK